MNIKEWNEAKKLKIESLENKLKFEKENIINELKDFVITQKEIDYLYWETDINTSVIADAVGTTPHKLKPTPIKYPINCEDCGIHLENILIPTREKMKKKNIDAIKGVKVKTVCNKCQEIRDKNSVVRLKYMLYKNYLKTDHWLGLRKVMLDKFGYKCQVCDTTRGTMNVHHKNYERRGEELLTDLIVLCQSCHGKFHGTAVNPTKTPTTFVNQKLINAIAKRKLGN